MRTWLLLTCLLVGVWSSPAAAQMVEPPLAESYLLQGKLAEGEKALLERLKDTPNDDQVRFGLAMLQFVRTFERLVGNVYDCGLRTEDTLLRINPEFERYFPDNPKPKKVAYSDIRELIQTFLNDLATIEANLALVKDPDVKLPLHVGMIQINPFREAKTVSAAALFRGGAEAPWDKDFVIAFDRGDVEWLRGYCHFLAGFAELSLAVDGQEVFDCSAHLFLKHVETPHAFLLEDRATIQRDLFANLSTPQVILDAVSFVHHILRLPLKEPERTKVALAHFEAMIVHGKAQWKFIREEKDNDREWVPNARQNSVTRVPVTDEIIDAWLATLEEADQVLKGKKLIPFWRGVKKRGVNLRRVFTEPRTFDLVEWVQGTGATPYLEEGPLTEFANERFVERTFRPFNTPFGFAGFAFWFN